MFFNYRFECELVSSDELGEARVYTLSFIPVD